MATYNSAIYAQQINNIASATGRALPVTTIGSGKRNGATKGRVFVDFDTSLQNLATSSVVNLVSLPPDTIVTAITLVCDTATSSATTQVGITGTAGYFSTSAIATATAAKFDMFTNLSNYGSTLSATAETVVIATFAGAAVNTGKLYFVIDYLSN
jgi:hypothetical protein